MKDLLVAALPKFVAFVDEAYLVSNFHYGVHVVGVDYRCDVVLLGNFLNEAVNYNGCCRVKA